MPNIRLPDVHLPNVPESFPYKVEALKNISKEELMCNIFDIILLIYHVLCVVNILDWGDNEAPEDNR